jgi:hypothetical protein
MSLYQKSSNFEHERSMNFVDKATGTLLKAVAEMSGSKKRSSAAVAIDDGKCEAKDTNRSLPTALGVLKKYMRLIGCSEAGGPAALYSATLTSLETNNEEVIAACGDDAPTLVQRMNYVIDANRLDDM